MTIINNLSNLDNDEEQLLSAALIFCDKNHPYYKKEFRKLWNKLFLQSSLFDWGHTVRPMQTDSQ